MGVATKYAWSSGSKSRPCSHSRKVLGGHVMKGSLFPTPGDGVAGELPTYCTSPVCPVVFYKMRRIPRWSQAFDGIMPSVVPVALSID